MGAGHSEQLVDAGCACVRVCACVRACVRACVCACVCVCKVHLVIEIRSTVFMLQMTMLLLLVEVVGLPENYAKNSSSSLRTRFFTTAATRV